MNVKQKIDQITLDIVDIKKDVDYIKQIVEDIQLSMRPKESNNALENMMSNIQSMLHNDPNLKNKPEILNTVDNLFKVKP